MNDINKYSGMYGGGASTKQPSTEIQVDTTKQTAADGEWWIPKGFKEAKESASTIKEGKVIQDSTGNEWVWIPCYIKEGGVGSNVSSATKYQRTAFKGEDITSTNTETLDLTDTASIEKYGGFYIGRYEAGADIDVSSEDNSRKVYIQKNKVPYRYISLENCKILSTNFASDNKYDTSKVYTKLVSSYAWDTALSFIAITNSSYPTNSTQGIYGQSSYKNTGSSTAVCNIYDMGGNLWEYTSESYSSGSYPYTGRGGYYGSSVFDHPAGCRACTAGGADFGGSFRPLLYIK